MRYCRSCKTRAADNATICVACGKPLSNLGDGAGGGGGSGGAATLTLRGQIEQLEAIRTETTRRNGWLLLACLLVLLAIGFTIYQVFHHRVLSYAVLEQVEIQQDPEIERKITVKFQVASPGKVAMTRTSGGRTTEKLDILKSGRSHTLSWTWPSDQSTGIDFDLTHRKGWSRVTEKKHFDLTGKTKGGKVDVVFLMDTTLSMDPFIEGLKRKCTDFARIVEAKGHDSQLALIGFGDVEIKEPIHVRPLTKDVQLFQTDVGNIPRTKGGDLPESALEAIDEAMKLPFRTDATVCFILITDADCHHEQRIPEVANNLKQKNVKSFIVSREQFRKTYTNLCVGGGRYFSLETAKSFDEVLEGVATTIVDQIGYGN